MTRVSDVFTVHLNGSLLGGIILLSDEVDKGRSAGFTGPHVTDGVMPTHVGSNLLQQLWLENVLAYLYTDKANLVHPCSQRQ